MSAYTRVLEFEFKSQEDFFSFKNKQLSEYSGKFIGLYY